MAFNVNVTSNVDRLAADLMAVGTRLSKIGPPIVRENGRKLQEMVRDNASGRPGPEVITGAYRESIKYRPRRVSRGFAAEVYSDAPQAMRLEYGFVGVDSQGRNYSQPPFPHFRPALDEIEPDFYDAISAAVGKALQ